MPKKFIFDESSSLHYYDLLNNFYEYFVDKLLLTGIAKNGSSILDIHFQKTEIGSEIYNELFYTIILAEIDNMRPDLKVQLIENNRIKSECLYYDIAESSKAKYFFMVQNTMDWPMEPTFNCCVYSLIEPNQETIKNYWRS